jgi:hypothetical protein
MSSISDLLVLFFYERGDPFQSTCHMAFGRDFILRYLHTHVPRVSFHDVEVEAEAALEALRTFCRNTAIDKH